MGPFASCAAEQDVSGFFIDPTLARLPALNLRKFGPTNQQLSRCNSKSRRFRFKLPLVSPPGVSGPADDVPRAAFAGATRAAAIQCVPRATSRFGERFSTNKRLRK